MRSAALSIMFVLLSLIPASSMAGGLYWTESSGEIFRADLDGGQTDLIHTPHGPNGYRAFSLAVDLLNEHLYWQGLIEIDDVALRRSNLSGLQDVTILPYRFVGGVAVDPLEGHLYYTTPTDCYPCGEVRRANLDGSGVQILVQAADPGAIVIDPIARRMWWSDGGSIRRADLNGGSVNSVVADTWPLGLALDSQRGKLYWTDRARQLIRRANVDGTQIEDVASSPFPWGIAVDSAAGKVYWSDRDTGTIQRTDLDGSAGEIFQSGLDEPEYMALEVEPPLPPDPAVVPTLSEWGLAALGLLLLTTGLFFFRRVP